MKSTPLNAMVMLIGAAFTATAYAAVTTDADGNTAYDTAAECDAAVLAGQARFYQPQTKMPPLLRAGEKSVKTGKLSDLGPQYRLGACDLGVGRQNNRNGVSKALRGKYVPFGPNSAVNIYADATGKAVRVSMAQCDNRFSDVMPRPVAAPAPVAMVAPASAPVVAPAVPVAPAPVLAAPVATPVVAEPVLRMTPYLFGTVGMVNDSVNFNGSSIARNVGDSGREFGVQGGLGLQINPLLGVEVFHQGGKAFEYQAVNGYTSSYATQATGARLTVGTGLTDKLRVFGKLGMARIKHSSESGTSLDQSGASDSYTKTRPTYGVGLSYSLSDSLAVRADMDHYMRTGKSNNPRWGHVDYFGLGLQYNY